MDYLNFFVLIILTITSTGLLFSRKWRLSIGFLAAQYVGVFWMVNNQWSIPTSSVIIVTGWMACVVLGIAHRNFKQESEPVNSWRQVRFLQVFITILILLISFLLARNASAWLGLDFPISWGGLVLLGFGILCLGITSDASQIVFGLLAVLSGFEILYSAVESSSLVIALIALVNLGLALVGAHFLARFQE